LFTGIPDRLLSTKKNEIGIFHFISFRLSKLPI